MPPAARTRHRHDRDQPAGDRKTGAAARCVVAWARSVEGSSGESTSESVPTPGTPHGVAGQPSRLSHTACGPDGWNPRRTGPRMSASPPRVAHRGISERGEPMDWWDPAVAVAGLAVGVVVGLTG